MTYLQYDFIGKTFTNLTVLSREAGKWVCSCSCGGTKHVETTDLRLERVKSCGCLSNVRESLKVQAKSGDRYGRLTLVREEAQQGQFRMFTALCDCGKTTLTRLGGMRSGNTKSCGCLVGESLATTTHGMSGTRVHRMWRAMLTRATNPNILEAKHYSLRGITVSDSWRIFENFYADMGDPPQGSTLDRRDNDGNYCAENCRWATTLEQSRNRERRGSKKLGVNQMKNGKWRAVISTLENRALHLGVFDSYEDAVSCRLAAEIKHWGT